jgi:hypothetical protein
MGLDETAAYESVRFAVAEDTSPDDLEFAVGHLVDLCAQLRSIRRPMFASHPNEEKETAR